MFLLQSFIDADNAKGPTTHRLVNGYPPQGTSPRNHEATPLKATDVGSYTATTTTFRCSGGGSVGARGQRQEADNSR